MENVSWYVFKFDKILVKHSLSSNKRKETKESMNKVTTSYSSGWWKMEGIEQEDRIMYNYYSMNGTWHEALDSVRKQHPFPYSAPTKRPTGNFGSQAREVWLSIKEIIYGSHALTAPSCTPWRVKWCPIIFLLVIETRTITIYECNVLISRK